MRFDCLIWVKQKWTLMKHLDVPVELISFKLFSLKECIQDVSTSYLNLNIYKSRINNFVMSSIS
jgi:hypothetical protein